MLLHHMNLQKRRRSDYVFKNVREHPMLDVEVEGDSQYLGHQA